MNDLTHLVRSDLRRLAKTPSLPLLWLAFPIVLSLIFFAAFGQLGSSGGTVPRGTLLLVDQDRTVASGFLRSALQREPMSQFIELAESPDETQIAKQFQNNKASAALIVPKGFQDSLLAGTTIDLPLTPNPRQSIRPKMIDASLGTFFEIANRAVHELQEPLRRIRTIPSEQAPQRESVLAVSALFYDGAQRLQKLGQLRGLDLRIERPTPKPQSPARSGNVGSFFTYFLPGLLLFSLLMVGEGFEKRFFHDRLHGISRRVAASPVARRTVLLSESVSILIGTLLCAIVVMSVAVVFFKVRLREPLALGLVLLGFGLVVVGLMKSLFARPRSERAASNMASAVILVTTLIGGGFAPVEFFAENVKPVASLTPVGGASQSMLDVLAHGRSLADVGPQVLTTWAWGVGLCFLGFSLSRRTHASS